MTGERKAPKRASAWQPIATAPRRGPVAGIWPEIIGRDALMRCRVIAWSPANASWLDHTGNDFAATHWAELPL
jgi:hypothetical protein